MSRTRTLTNLLLDIRQRTNQENSTFVTDAELTEYLNQELAELWGRLVGNAGQPFYRSERPISVTSGTAVYALPSDFWTLQEVTATVNGITGTLYPFMAAERARLTNSFAGTAFDPVMYRIQGDNIEFLPSTQTFTATVYYSPAQPRLVNGADVFDGFNGYEMAAIYGVCAIVAAKEESDPSFHEARKAAIYARIDREAAHRDMANPERVAEVRDVDEYQLPGTPFGWRI